MNLKLMYGCTMYLFYHLFVTVVVDVLIELARDCVFS